MADLELRNIKKSYGSNKVIDNFNLSIKSGEFVTLLGPSGCGKTTILRMMAGLEKIDSGELYIGGKLMNRVPPQLRPIGMVFQSYALFPHMNVRNNITFGLKVQKVPEHTIFERLEWVIPLLRLEGLEKRLPKEISGGQRQRVALARSLVLDPAVLLLDEPLSNLDAALRELAMEELKRIHIKVGKTIVYVSHNQAEAMSMSQRIAVLHKGNLEQYDSPSILYDNPSTKFSAQFIGSPVTNSYDGVVKIVKNAPYVSTPLGLLKLNKDSDINWNVFDGREVTACIRPQDIHSVGHKYSGDLERSITNVSVKVVMVETPGDRNLIVAECKSGETVRFFMNRAYSLKSGDDCSIEINGLLVHLFDKKSGGNIFSEQLLVEM
jgi:ABC-type sugar transport system ATPase subunit